MNKPRKEALQEGAMDWSCKSLIVENSNQKFVGDPGGKECFKIRGKKVWQPNLGHRGETASGLIQSRERLYLKHRPLALANPSFPTATF